MNPMDKKSRLLLGALTLAAVASLGATFYRTVVLGDFEVTAYEDEETLEDEAAMEEEATVEEELPAEPEAGDEAAVPVTELDSELE